jgi:hypothetical protein
MISYQKLAEKPRVFKSITGLDIEEFERLFGKLVPVWVAEERKRLDRPGRKRAIGGGRKYTLKLRDRLIMVTCWLRLYLNTEAMGFFFGVDKATVSRNCRRLLRVLRMLGGSNPNSLLLTDDLDQHALPTPAVELAVEYLLPRAKVEPPIGDCHDDLAAHHLALQVGVAVVLAGAVVAVAADGFVGCQFLQPLLVIGVQAPLVVVDKHAGGDMHSVYKGQCVISHMPLSFP